MTRRALRRLADVVRPWSSVDVVTGRAAGQPLLLVRPDRYIAWASEPADAVRCQSALPGWCGRPVTPLRGSPAGKWPTTGVQ